MPGLRVVLVSRRFWPLLGGAEIMMARMARELREQGHSPLVLTARWDRAWPAELDFGGVPLLRLNHPAVKMWGTFRYMQALARWLKQNRSRYDLVYVSMLKHDAYAALGALRNSESPVVLRAEGGGPGGDCAWQQTARFGARMRARCQTAAAVVAPSPAIAAELVAAHYAADRVHVFPNGVAPREVVSSEERLAARRDAAEFYPQLAMPDEAPLAIYTGRLVEGKGLIELVDAFAGVLIRFPQARLWLVGEGPLAPRLKRRIGEWGWPHRMALLGQVDNVSDLLAAADLFVLPSHEEGLSLALLEAMATGLACVASDVPGNRAALEHERHGLLVPPRSPPQLTHALCRVLEYRPWGRQLGEAARGRVLSEFSLAQTVAAQVRLFERLLGRPAGGLPEVSS